MKTETKKVYTLQDVLNAEEGAKFKISTDNDLYGTTVKKTATGLVNFRTSEPMKLTVDLINSKFRPAMTAREVGIQEFLSAYTEGKEVALAFDGEMRTFHKYNGQPEDAPIAQIFSIASGIPFDKLMSHRNVVSFEELIKGKFYITN